MSFHIYHEPSRLGTNCNGFAHLSTVRPFKGVFQRVPTRTL